MTQVWKKSGLCENNFLEMLFIMSFKRIGSLAAWFWCSLLELLDWSLYFFETGWNCWSWIVCMWRFVKLMKFGYKSTIFSQNWIIKFKSNISKRVQLNSVVTMKLVNIYAGFLFFKNSVHGHGANSYPAARQLQSLTNFNAFWPSSQLEFGHF